MRHLIRVIRRHDLTQKKGNDLDKYKYKYKDNDNDNDNYNDKLVTCGI